MLDFKFDMFSHTSDHFDTIIKFAEQMIIKEQAFIDDTPTEKMREEREQRIKSSNRDNCKYVALWVRYKHSWYLLWKHC